MQRMPALAILALTFTFACSSDDGGQTTNTDSESGSSSETGTGTETETETETGTDTETETGEQSCYAELHAIVSDIDETLTTADSEFVMQLLDSTYDPLERGEASELITDYHSRGYTIVYLTARSSAQTSMDAAMIPAYDLTFDWLEAHGFPVDENTQLFLAPNFVFGDEAAAYKGQTLLDLQAEGFTFDYAYGNATSDIDAYEMAGIPKDVTFIIGPEAGVDGTVAVAGEDWIAHRAEHIPTVPNYCE
jgi:phosphatidate phosphatase PAH1